MPEERAVVVRGPCGGRASTCRTAPSKFFSGREVGQISDLLPGSSHHQLTFGRPVSVSIRNPSRR